MKQENGELSEVNNGICERKIKWLKNAVPAMVITAVTFLVVFLCFDIIYAINDDLMIESMLSGSYLEQYPFTYYLSSELGIIISVLYRIIPGFAWLGIFFVACYVFCFFQIANKLNNCLKDKKLYVRVIAFFIFELVFIVMLLSNLVLIHYTVVAAVVGATGIVLFILSKEPKEFAVPVFLFILCYMIRENVFFMLLPLVGIVFIYLLLNNQDLEIQKNGYIAKAAIFIGLFVIVFLGNNVLLSKSISIWKDYIEFNNLRTSVYDYTGIDDSNGAMAYYAEKAGMTSTDLELYNSYDIALKNIDDSKTELAIIEHWAKQHDNSGQFLSKVKWHIYNYAYRMLKQETDMPFNAIAIGLYVLAIITAIICKCYKNIIFIGLTGMYRSVLWVYLLYKGRYPERVTISIYIMEILLMLALIFRIVLDSKGINNKMILTGAGILILSFGITAAGQISKLQSEYQAKINVNSVDDVIYSYINEHPENNYLIDVYATVGHSKKALEKGVEYENYLLLGGWQINHPLYLSKLMAFGCKDNQLTNAFKVEDNMYIVIRQDEGEDLQKMSELMGVELQEIEYIPSGDTGFYILGK